MKADELKRLLDRPSARPLSAIEMRVAVHRPGSIGPSPTAGLISGTFGFDWNAGQFILMPEAQLTVLTPAQVDDITASVRLGQSWHAYQEQKKLRARIVELETAFRKLGGYAVKEMR